jgi:hypothetical protein
MMESNMLFRPLGSVFGQPFRLDNGCRLLVSGLLSVLCSFDSLSSCVAWHTSLFAGLRVAGFLEKSPVILPDNLHQMVKLSLKSDRILVGCSRHVDFGPRSYTQYPDPYPAVRGEKGKEETYDH